jgi:aminopeptidase-like protein
MAEPFTIPDAQTRQTLGQNAYRLLTELFPLCRSLSGNDVRRSLDIIEEVVPLTRTEVPSGTQVFDWTVPKEWNALDAYVAKPNGERIIDFQKSNLHLLGYSQPVRGRMTLDELRPHLFTLEQQPELVPYLTSYYDENWGFCISRRQLDAMEEGDYDVVIDTTLEDGSMTYAEAFVEGELPSEVLITCYTCHPSMANDSLSGVVMVAFLANYLRQHKTKYSYRFLFIPETIGSIAWLAGNEERLDRIYCGLVCTCCGDRGALTYKRSRKGNTIIDRAAEHVLSRRGDDAQIEDFAPYGSDERQFCSPGFNLAVGSLMRTRYGKFDAYHTSADDLNFVGAEYLADTLTAYAEVIHVLEQDATFVNTNPKCEPQLGKRGLYRAIGGQKLDATEDEEIAILWVLNLSDGEHSLLDIAERSGMKFETIRRVSDLLLSHGLLRSAG